MMWVEVEKELQGAEGPIRLQVDMTLSRGEIVALTGPSGSGKTTLLRILAGLENADSGSVRFDREVWLDTSAGVRLAPQKRGVGMVFQDYALFPHMTVRENLAYALPGSADPGSVDHMLGAIELERLADRRPGHLSGGQLQRVALARALIRRPRLLLLDEPLSALDLITRGKLQTFLQKELAERKLTTILVTHQLEEMKRLADRVLWLNQGRVEAEGGWEEVLPHYLKLWNSD